MKTVSEYIDRPLRIVKKSFFGFEYNLLAGEELIGALQIRLFNKGGFVTGLGKKNIQFYKSNFFSREILIREEGKELPFASYRRDFASLTGEATLPGNNKLFIRFGYFDVSTEIKDEKENTLIVLKRAGLFSRTMNVLVKSKSQLVDENPWILFLTLYMIIKRRNKRRR